MDNTATKLQKINGSKLFFLFNISIINDLITIMSNQNLLYTRLRSYFGQTEYSG